MFFSCKSRDCSAMVVWWQQYQLASGSGFGRPELLLLTLPCFAGSSHQWAPPPPPNSCNNKLTLLSITVQLSIFQWSTPACFCLLWLPTQRLPPDFNIATTTQKTEEVPIFQIITSNMPVRDLCKVSDSLSGDLGALRYVLLHLFVL